MFILSGLSLIKIIQTQVKNWSQNSPPVEPPCKPSSRFIWRTLIFILANFILSGLSLIKIIQTQVQNWSQNSPPVEPRWSRSGANHHNCGASSEFVSSSILSWQILTGHAQLFSGARDLAFCLKVPLDSLLVWASSGGSDPSLLA